MKKEKLVSSCNLNDSAVGREVASTSPCGTDASFSRCKNHQELSTNVPVVTCVCDPEKENTAAFITKCRDYVRAFGIELTGKGIDSFLLWCRPFNRHLKITKHEHDEIVSHLMFYNPSLGGRTASSLFEYTHSVISAGSSYCLTITRKQKQGNTMVDDINHLQTTIKDLAKQLGVKTHESALTMAKDSLCTITYYDTVKPLNSFEYSYTPQSTYYELMKAIHDHFNLSDRLIKPTCASDPVYMCGFSHDDINTLVSVVSRDLNQHVRYQSTNLPGMYRKHTTGYNTFGGTHSVEITMDKDYRTDTIEIKITFPENTHVN